ncbi:MAG: 2-hydroxyacyl-CoA dehydratase family protein [Armatimonadetes bacterium]|nr:2-hydroxyacyl-CoA dehydratase family protein [Armatimonadota bacterium]
MERYNTRALQAAQEGIPVAWVTAVFPVEILYAMDIFPYYPENFGAAAGTHRRTEELSKIAENEGYSARVCAYTRAGLGLMYGFSDFGKEIPKPDILLPCNIQCACLYKWFEITAKFYNLPLFLLDGPQIDEPSWEVQKQYFIEQLNELIGFLEKTTRKKLNMNRLSEVLELSTEACTLWNKVLASAKTKPARLTYWDACILMGPIVTLRGTKEALNYYSELSKELEERDKGNISAVPGEKIRLYWDHIPIWPRMRFFSELFGFHQAAVVCSLYTHSWAYRFDPERPLESLTENYLREFVNWKFERRVEKKVKLMREYDVDGFIFNLNNSCKPNSLALVEKRNVITEQLNIPGLLLEADMCDLRFFDEGTVKNRVESFLEMVSRQ